MNSDEIRKAYLKFFEEKGHKVIPSSSLVPKDDPTLLLTTAGVVQIKPYFLGQAVPPAPRLASCQKCFRTTDIEEVGDATHLTFFEMLGNFSVGDYFKKEAIAWAWEFVTKRMKIPEERLWITIFFDDNESFNCWREIGIPEEKIVRCGEEDNFWGPAGSSGPCGPCSEIHYDLGPDKGCGKDDCRPNCQCGRYTEIWNLVFTQYDQAEDGSRTPLPRPNIDTGMGLDRTAAAINGLPTVYDTDNFTSILERVTGLTGIRYGAAPESDTAMRVVADHGRALAFLIADGVMPGNEGRGYVLRRLLRRAALFGRRLGLEKPFLAEIARAAVAKMGKLYPELKQRQEYVYRVIEQEETRFSETLNTGLEIIERTLAEAGEGQETCFSGEEAFRLHDTYGFPIELTREIVTGRGIAVDMDGFEEEMTRQRERARASHKFDNAAVRDNLQLDVTGTEFVGYERLEQPARILKILAKGKEVTNATAGQEVDVILDTTPFYGEMGGQVGDAGEIIGESSQFTVADTVRVPPDVTLHRGRVAEGTISIGESVTASVDAARRRNIARNHTATHILQSALRRVLGEHIQQRGSLVAPDRLRFDFSHLGAMGRDEIKRVERVVNEEIRHNLTVHDETVPYDDAVRGGAIALFDEKYGDTVRVLKIGDPPVSMELCGGTHVNHTGEIGYFHIVSEGSIGAGLRRIEAVTGHEAEAFIDRRLESLENIARSLETTPDDAAAKVALLVEQLEKERKQALKVEKEASRKEAEALLAKAEEINGVNVIAARVTAGSQAVLRDMSDFIRDRMKSGIIVLGAVGGERPIFVTAVSPDLVEKGYNAGDIIKQVSGLTGGGGGGKAGFAQAGGRDKDRLDEALGLVRKLVEERGN